MNKNLFLSVMVANGEKRSDVADLLGISMVTLCRKINEIGNATFTQPEMLKYKQHYNVSNEVMGSIFFAD